VTGDESAGCRSARIARDDGEHSRTDNADGRQSQRRPIGFGTSPDTGSGLLAMENVLTLSAGEPVREFFFLGRRQPRS